MGLGDACSGGEFHDDGLKTGFNAFNFLSLCPRFDIGNILDHLQVLRCHINIGPVLLAKQYYWLIIKSVGPVSFFSEQN